LRADAGAAQGERHITHYKGVLAFEVIHHEGPINGGVGGLTDAVFVDIADDTDNFAPVVFGADANAFAERGGGVMPMFAGDVFRDDGDGEFLVGVIPGEVAARQ
jgi:hypothetical protein